MAKKSIGEVMGALKPAIDIDADKAIDLARVKRAKEIAESIEKTKDENATKEKES